MAAQADDDASSSSTNTADDDALSQVAIMLGWVEGILLRWYVVESPSFSMTSGESEAVAAVVEAVVVAPSQDEMQDEDMVLCKSIHNNGEWAGVMKIWMFGWNV